MNYIIKTESLNTYYNNFHALKNINIQIKKNAISAIIGPSGCGKTTLLRCFNRMNDTIKGFKLEGKVIVKDKDIYKDSIQLTQLRKQVGMVFQRPNPFPFSVFENIAFGLKIHKQLEKINEVVKKTLSQTDLWIELKDKLNTSALNLSPEQQQRLCISRVLAVEPEIILMDEPCSSLDPIATGHIEELMQELKKKYTIVIVTHNMQQAARVADETFFMLLGELIESGPTKEIFTNPKDKKTEQYITGHFG